MPLIVIVNGTVKELPRPSLNNRLALNIPAWAGVPITVNVAILPDGTALESPVNPGGKFIHDELIVVDGKL